MTSARRGGLAYVHAVVCLCRRKHEAGSWWTATQAVTPEKQQEEQREQNDHHETRGILRSAPHHCPRALDPSAALLRDFPLLQARGEMLSILLMRKMEMTF